MIRHATLHDLSALLTIKDLAIAKMLANQIFQWDDTYPTEAILIDDINQHHLYVLEDKNNITGFACIDTKQSPEYQTLSWQTSNSSYVIHRLAIHPHYAGKGYAKSIMQFAEQLALTNGHTSMRIDTFSQNILAQNLFKSQGYTYVGSVYFDKPEPFYCYEKTLED